MIRRSRLGARRVKAAEVVDNSHYIKVQLKLIAKFDAEAEALERKRTEALDEIKVLYEGMEVEVTDGVYEVKRVIKPGRASTKINVQKFKKVVTDEKTFWDAITIPVGVAKELLSEKELAKVSDTTYSADSPPEVVVAKLKPKK